jgi:hypothetical protein
VFQTNFQDEIILPLITKKATQFVFLDGFIAPCTGVVNLHGLAVASVFVDEQQWCSDER